MKGQQPDAHQPSEPLRSHGIDVAPADSGSSTPSTAVGSAAAAAASAQPAGSSSSYSPHSQPFADRPSHRTAAGVAARETLSSLPSPPAFTPAAGQHSQQSGPAPSGGASNTFGGAADTPGVTSAWQPAGSISTLGEGSRQASFAFTPVDANDASPDGQPFTAAAAAPQQQQQQAASTADVVRSVTRALTATTGPSAADAVSDASDSITSSSTRSLAPGQSPGHLLREATSRLRADKAISECFCGQKGE